MTDPQSPQDRGPSKAGDSIPGETVVSTPGAPMGAVETEPLGGQPESRRIRIKEEANRLVGEAGAKARSAADEGKAKAASTLTHLAQSTRDAGRQFEGGEAEGLVSYIDTAARSIEDFARRIDQKSVDEIIDDMREMVRRSPAIAIGAAAAVGFAISRFAKATERGTSEIEGDEPPMSDQPRYDA